VYFFSKMAALNYKEETRSARQHAMSTEPSPFQEGEYIILTRHYRDIPEGSVGTIAEIYMTQPPCYRVFFGAEISRGPISENYLARLRARAAGKHT